MTPQEACNFPLDLENHYGYVYCVTFPSSKKYIGQSKRPWKYRWKCHHSDTSFCPAMKNALQKYNTEELVWELLCYADSPQELTDKETYYIQKLSTLAPGGYNISLPCKAYPYPEEKADRIRLGLALHHLRKTNSDATIEDAKYYIAHKDDKPPKLEKGSPEWIEKYRIATEKRRATMQARGKNMSDIMKRVAKEKPSMNQGMCVALIVYETGEQFESIADFCNKYNVISSCASFCLQKKNKEIGGMHIYPASCTQEELQEYIKFWNEPKKVPKGILTCVETGKTYRTAKEAADELCVLRSRIHMATRRNLPVNGFHFIYAPAVGVNPNGGKSVKCLETGKIYTSQREAARDILKVTDEGKAKAGADQIKKVIEGSRKDFHGYHFTYVATGSPLTISQELL